MYLSWNCGQKFPFLSNDHCRADHLLAASRSRVFLTNIRASGEVMKPSVVERRWIEEEKDDGTVACSMVQGLDRGQLYLGASAKPCGQIPKSPRSSSSNKRFMMKKNPLLFLAPNEQILALAQSYDDAANILDGSGVNALPILSLRMHAIELFLKSLVAKTLSADQGNFGFLARIKRRENYTLSSTFEKVDYRHKTRLLGARETLSCDLKDLERLFQDSRYAYGIGKNLNIGLCQRVVGYLAKETPNLVRITRMSEAN